MKYTVNGKPVEYCYIQRKNNEISIEYSETYNIQTAHLSETMKKIREMGYDCIISKRLDKNLIMFLFHNKEDITPILQLLGVPYEAVTINEEDLFAYIHTKKLGGEII